MREQHLNTLILSVACGMLGCATQEPVTPPYEGSGGHSTVGAGGSNANGGAGTAGHTGVATGGTTAIAGTGGHGGVPTGGTNAGGSSLGGTGTAGMSSGGREGLGGSGGSAGSANGGSPASAGSGPGAGGVASGGIGAGGSGAGRGGTTALGGAAGSGMSGAGGASDPPCPPATPRTGGKQYCGTSADGTAVGNYTYNLYSDGMGSGCLTVFGVDATFKCDWTNVGDWIGRVGLSFDKTKTYDKIGVFSSDFAYTATGITTGGFGNIGIYGWSVNPLHEYYIAENWLGKKPNFTKVGSFTIDGEGTYDVMTNTQTNQPNITGTNATFVQYWSVRTVPRTCGHVSISKHFDEWASLGLALGNLEEARILVEAQNNTGSIEFTTATVVVK